ncbi:MAG: matrixin family metalloprotease, partial [Proteobacteria bacterium]|nr:matrixin family metalloprotease [Pseudomonadota bacterium]
MNEGEPTLALLLCRWVTPAVIPVSLPPDASAAERSLLGKALSAWEVALPVRFEQTSAVLARLEIRFARVGEGDPRRTSGLTAADCDLRESPPSVERAVVSLRRANLDVLDRPVALSDEELLGTALHELGHALGFQGHVAHGRSVMVRNTEAVRRMGRGVLAGEALRAPSVQALYRVPSGAIVGRIGLSS